MRINQFVGDTSIFDNIKDIGNLNSKQAEGESSTGLNFIDTLKQKLDEVNDQQIKSEETTEAFIKGDNLDIHQVMLATEEAKMSLEMAVQVRNKLVEAYQELNQMQL